MPAADTAGILADAKGHLESALPTLVGGPVKILGIEPLAGGACQDNLKVELQVTGADGPRRLLRVLRADAPTSLAGSLDRRREFAVIRVARAAGVRTPAADWLAEGLLGRPGWGYFLDFVPGTAIGRQVLERPDLAAARLGLATTLAGELAKIHSIGAADLPELASDVPGVRGALEQLEAQVDALQEPFIALELVRRWLRERAPADGELVLLHGDFRTGNFMVAPEGLTAILDWEFAHFGPPEQDIAWIAVRDWRFGRLDKPVGGFSDRRPFWDAYEAASGRTLDPVGVHWWEVYGNARWATGCIDQAQRYRSGRQRDLELLAIGRRAPEMAWEAMRLIERGPPV